MAKVSIYIPAGVIADFKEHLGNIAEQSAEEIKEISQSLCPVNTGKLQRSIYVEKDDDSYTIGSDIDYASFIEYGTRHIAPQPFMRPALSQVLNQQ